MDFYKFAFVGTALNWVKTGMKQTPEELTHTLSILLEGQFAHAIENFRNAGNPSKTAE